MASTLGLSAMPRLGTAFAESGNVSYCDRPTSRFPAPIANRISVVVGFSETMRDGALPVGIGVPKSSRDSEAGARCGSPGRQLAAAELPAAINVRTRIRRRNTDTLALEEDARNAERVDHTSESPPVLPRGSVRSGANVSRLLAPGRAARLPDSP
jgi:hypothetical protein